MRTPWTPSPGRTLAALSLAALAACERPVARTDSRPAGAGDEVLARYGNSVITRGEVMRRAAPQIRSLRQEEYDVFHAAVEGLIVERLEKDAAAKRGISVSDLLKAEVDGKVPPEEPGEVETAYQAHKAQFAGRSPQQARDQIRAILLNDRLEKRRRAFRKTLMAEAGVKINLEAPRTAVALPAGAPTLGPSRAPVTIVEFADYQCPFCQRAEATVEEVLQKNAGRVRLVSLDFPVEMHPRAFPAAAAARCAGDQGRYWEYHRSLLTEPGDLGEADLARRAAALKLDAARFSACQRSGQHDEAIHSDADEGASLGVGGTPTFFVNGRMLVGARPIEEFQEIIDSELQGAQAKGR